MYKTYSSNGLKTDKSKRSSYLRTVGTFGPFDDTDSFGQYRKVETVKGRLHDKNVRNLRKYEFFLILNSDIRFRHGKTFSENRIAAASKSVFARPFHTDRTLKRYWLTTLQLRDIPHLYCDRNNNASGSENSPANDKNLQLFEQK